MRTTALPIRKVIDQYILDAITPENYDVVCTNDKEKLQFLADTFNSEYAEQKHRHISTQDALAYWFSGLPSVFNVVFSNYDIIQLAKSWGTLPQDATEKQEDKITSNYWIFMAAKTMQLMNRNGITING